MITELNLAQTPEVEMPPSHSELETWVHEAAILQQLGVPAFVRKLTAHEKSPTFPISLNGCNAALVMQGAQGIPVREYGSLQWPQEGGNL